MNTLEMRERPASLVISRTKNVRSQCSGLFGRTLFGQMLQVGGQKLRMLGIAVVVLIAELQLIMELVHAHLSEKRACSAETRCSTGSR